MAKAVASRAGTQVRPVDLFGDRGREIVGIVLFGFAAFLLISMASFVEVEGDASTGSSNLCGPIGQSLAFTALHWFGNAAYIGVIVLFTWSLSWVSRRPVRIGPFRILWLGLLLFASAALFSDFSSEAVALRIPDRGGLVGYELAFLLETGLGFGPWGTLLILVLGVALTFMLATDLALYAVGVWLVNFLRDRRENAVSVARATGPLFRSILASGGNAAEAPAAKPKRRRSPKKASTDIGVTDEEVTGPDSEQQADSDEEDEEVDLEDDDLDEEDLDEEDLEAEDDDDEGDDETDEDDGVEVEPSAGRKRSKKAVGKVSRKADVPSELPGEARGKGSRKATSKGAAKPSGQDVEALIAAATLAANVGEPSMLDEDPDSEVEPEPVVSPARRQAKIRLEPPKPQPRSAEFEKERTAFEAPASSSNAKYKYEFPSRQLLEKPSQIVSTAEFQKMIEENAEKLESALTSFKVEARVEEIQKGPVITMFELQVAPGTRVDRIRALEDDLAIRLKAPSVRIVAPIPGKSTIGIEVPNQIRETVCMRELLEDPTYDSSKYAVPVFLGKDAAGRSLIEDLARMPHLLVAGSTGSGKSVCLNTILMSILFTRTPEQVQMILIDPKMVELSLYENIPHLMCPVVRDMNRAAQILEWACTKMDERYEMLAEVGARNIFSFNKISEEEKRTKLKIAPDDDKFEPKMAFIVIVVDEFADLMMVGAKEVEGFITRLAQKSRAVGIHLILATQRPSTNVITGLIKANMPTRVSFQVTSKTDARVVLDQNGAEKLLGFGDMLYLAPRTSSLVRGQGAFVSDEEVNDVVSAVRVETPLYSRELMQKNARSDVDPREVDDLYDEATRFVCESQRGSASLLQRRFAIGYTRASRLIDLMAADGILGEFRNAQAREVLMTLDDYELRNDGPPSEEDDE